MREEETIMNLSIFDMPDDAAELKRWLEQKVAGRGLADFIAELSTMHKAGGIQTSETNPSLPEVLGAQKASLLDKGLDALTNEQVRTLLRHPNLLWELQDLILEGGGEYWLDLMNQVNARPTVSVESRSNALRTGTSGSGAAGSSRSNWRMVVVAVTTLAAALLGIVGYNQWMVPAGPTWGFSQPGLFEAPLDGPAYLEHLANAADAWFKKRPAESLALKNRLIEFRAGCIQLLDAKHSQLAQADRAWLRERCEKWIGKLDAHLAALDRTGSDFSSVLKEADSTIEELKTKLRAQAVLARDRLS
jgi:hypothetical protein